MELTELKISRTYAFSFVKAAKEKKNISGFLDQLEKICDIFKQNQSLIDFLVNPLIKLAQRKDMIESILKKAGIENEIINFLFVLIENGRIKLLEKILFFVRKLAKQEMGIISGTIFSVQELGPDTKKQLKSLLEKRYNQIVELKYELKPEIIGGILIHLDNHIIDYSVKGDLRRLQEALKQEG